jgi:hypothetical protein
MKWKFIDLNLCLNLISAIILVAGLGSAVLIYRAAENNSYGALGYAEEGGSVYPINPEDSKQYLHDLELYGGKINVIVDEWRRALVGLFRGKSLAFTVAFITVFTSYGVFYIANDLLSRLKSDDLRKNNRDGTG